MSLTPYDLRTEQRARPTEVDVPAPRFAWRLRSDVAGDDQRAVKIVVTDTAGTTLWHSGWMETAEVTARYAGAPLASFADYRWELSVRSITGAVGTATGEFETGAFHPEDWVAAWIARTNEYDTTLARPGVPFDRTWVMQMAQPALRVKRRFTLDHEVVRARLYSTARGVYRAFLNGERIGDDELAPGWTDYRQRIQYQAHDVTHLLSTGDNVIGLVAGEGWWSGCVGYDVRRHARHYGSRPNVFAQLVIDLADGERLVLGTDGSWSESTGEIIYDDLLMGEAHDQTLADPAWCTLEAAEVPERLAIEADRDTSALIGQVDEPVGVVGRFEGRVISRTDERILVDFAQNLVGRVAFRIDGVEPGQLIRIRHGEILDGDGELYTENLRSAEATDIVIPAGDTVEFEPWFTFHGFRYAELRGLPREARIESIEGVALSSRIPDAGNVETSSELVNQLLSNIRWGQIGNFLSVPTDCPQRDERLGWTADAQVFTPTAAYNSDIHAFFDRWLRDLSDDQLPSGSVPDVVPLMPAADIFDFGAPGWGDAATVIPWHLYRVYGDLPLLERQFDSMRAWVDYVSDNNPGGLWENRLGNNYGDWLSVDEVTDHVLVATAYRAHSLDLVAQAADALGRDVDARDYRALAATVRDAFTAAFVDGDRLTADTQSAYVFALAWRLVPDEHREPFAARLVEKIRDRGNRLTTGFLGVGLLCPTLCEIGETGLAYDLLLQTDYPSWGYSITQGATTIWERWDGWTDAEGFQAASMNSFNHYSLGSVGEWIYRGVAGIDQLADSVGFSALLIDPQFDERLDKVAASYESPRGLIRVEWRREGESLTIELDVPPGATAVAGFLPDRPTIASGSHVFVVAPQRRMQSQVIR